MHIEWNNGTVYDGDVNEEKQPHGKGRIVFPEGDHYEGDFYENTLTGEGVYTYTSGTVYRGHMINAIRNGYGESSFDNGTSYKGYWEDGLREGEGEQIYQDGFVYKGSWKNDLREGEGSLEYTQSFPYQHITGYFRNDVLYTGTFRYTWNDGYEVEGKYENGVELNTAVIRYPDGSVYEGEISHENGLICQGRGVLKDADGSTYEGTFDDNRKHGVFTVTKKDGSYQIVEYRKGELLAVIKSYDAKGNAVREEERETERNTPELIVDEEKYLTVQKEDDERYAEELRPYFRGIIGMDVVKEQLDRIYKRFKVDAMRQKMLGIQGPKQGYYFIVTGNPGTGKTTVARIIGRMLHDLGILPGENFIEADRSGLVGDYIGQTEKKTREVIEKARGGTLFIDEAYTLYRKDSSNDFGKEAIDTLLKDMEDHRGEFCVILAGYQSEMQDMIRNANPGLSSRFDHKINIPDYSSEELTDILTSMALLRSFFIEKDARAVILSKITKEKIDDTFDNARYARRLLDEAIEKQALRLAESFDGSDLEALQVLKAEDFGEIEQDEGSLRFYMDKLNHLIGLPGVKKEISDLVKTIEVRNESQRRGLSIAGGIIPLNMVFTGNPGTGKTTVARLLGHLYYELGLLKRADVFVECGRSDLVGRYQGETALKVREVVRKALGGVLFIDEAYSLVSGEGDTFGLEAVNTLVAEIENNRDKLAVILAGYTEDMNSFLDANPGLRSRLSRTIEFEDYTAEELSEILLSDLRRRGYQTRIEKTKVLELIKRESSKKDFGNARGARNTADRIIQVHNRRINEVDLGSLTNEEILTITDEDLDI